ncbi:unnamed protein product [Candidula unifasciata]|uniref:C3H1-type domain-containing protein n=1 Tax=Candidula unifasciata TaxID=100452 RepID=A0A8S3YED4_9EUPU|nr:unnamed protein product [Candidula unifasciata]
MEGDSTVAGGGGREPGKAITNLPSPSDESQVAADVDLRLGSEIHHHFTVNQNNVPYGGGKSNINFPHPGSNPQWESSKYVIGGHVRDDHISKLSPFSNENSEGSEREILLEPLSADDESTPVSESRAVSADAPDDEVGREVTPSEDPSSGAAFGPSEDREDISDEELDLYSQENGDNLQPEVWPSEDIQESNHRATYNADGLYAMPETPAEMSYPLVTSETVHFNENDARDSHSSDDREIIDLKYDDTAGKSDAGSHDDGINQQSNVPSEDLETVSDDELPDGTLVGDTPVEPAFNLIEGGEEVSSSEDEAATSLRMHDDPNPEVCLVNRTNSLVLDGAEFSYMNVSSDLPFPVDEVSALPLISDSASCIALPLPPLEAEPISDEEDSGQGNGGCVDVEGGEAGEIKSPADAGSPASLSGQTAVRLLGEVEPISADESSDTDGELHSGDEDSLSKPENGGTKSNNFLEAIDSDDEGDLGPGSSHKHLSSDRRQTPVASSESVPKEKTEYMESISDEDDSLSVNGKEVKRSGLSVTADESLTGLRGVEAEKRQIATNYSEHQEELDYEENDGDEGEGRSAAEAVKPTEKKDSKEAKEDGEGGFSDKDEGELSDDDCEEGEIKEPGSKKPFIKQTCRFFQRGNCTWGINCRFIHPGINDKGNYQMIEIPGFKPVGIRSRLGIPGSWPEQPEEQIDLPPPPIPDVPPVETAWERGLRIAKEQRKKASERKEQEADFEDKRLNLSVDEERELNKENERMPKIIPKDPYYDQYGVEEDNYYHTARDPWQTGRYENFEVRYNTDHAYSPPYREKPPIMPLPPPPARFGHPYSPQADKFGRDRVERREPLRPEGPPPSLEYPTAKKRPDEWTDPWRRSKSPKSQKPKVRSRSRGRRTRRSVSDSSNSSRSSSGSSSGSSRSSRSFNSSTGSSSRSRSPEPVPPVAEKHDRYISPSREPPRSTVSIRGSGNYNHYDQGYRRGGRMYDHNRGPNNYNQRGGGGGNRGGGGGPYNNYGPMGGYPPRDMRDRERPRDDRIARNNRGRSPPDRPLPYVRPRPKSVSSHSSSSRSRSWSRGRATSSRSRSRSSSASSRSSSSSSSSAGSADSEHLYRDLASPSKNPRAPAAQKRKRNDSVKDRPLSKTQQIPLPPGSQRRPPQPPQPPVSLEHIPPPRDPKPPLPPLPSGRPDSKYASRNAPPPPVKAKDPLKVVGQKSNIKLTLLPKQQQQSSLGARPNPLDSPPHKRRLSERDTSPPPAPPAKRANLPVPSQSTALRLAIEKASKIQIRQEKGKSPPPAVAPQSLPSASLSANLPRAKAAVSPQKQPGGVKPRVMEPPVAKTVPKVPAANIPAPTVTGTKVKKSMSSRREELLKQLKAVEDAIARKKSKFQ